MKTRSTIIVITLFAAILAVASWAAPEPVAAGSPEMNSPRTLYVQNCSKCHGADGKGDTPKGRELDADDLTSRKVKGKSTPSISRTIKNGKGDMPGFGKKLTASEIASIAAYVRSL